MRYLVLVGAVLLGASLSGASPQSSPREELEKALSLLEMCEYTSFKTEYDSKGKEWRVGTDSQDNGAVMRLSLPKLFRPGRFALSFAPDVMTPQNVLARVIHFSPLPDHEQLKPANGEDPDDVLVMNNMSGDVYIDRVTGGLIRTESRLDKSLSWRVRKVKVFELKSTYFLLEQYRVGDKWLPWSFYLDLSYWKVLVPWKTYGFRYHVKFECE